MINQSITPLPDPGPNIDQLSNEQCVRLLLTTTSTQAIDQLERHFSYRLKAQPVLREALYEVARQNARYRRALAPDEALPQADIYQLSIADLLDLLSQTHDSGIVDMIETWTSDRLRRLPDFRQGLFAIARTGVAYRLASQAGTKASDSLSAEA